MGSQTCTRVLLVSPHVYTHVYRHVYTHVHRHVWLRAVSRRPTLFCHPSSSGPVVCESANTAATHLISAFFARLVSSSSSARFLPERGSFFSRKYSYACRRQRLTASADLKGSNDTSHRDSYFPTATSCLFFFSPFFSGPPASFFLSGLPAFFFGASCLRCGPSVSAVGMLKKKDPRSGLSLLVGHHRLPQLAPILICIWPCA